MTYAELKAEAEKQGYKLYKTPDYQCSCYMQYPNKYHKHKNGKWKCIDKYEPIKVMNRGNYNPCTHCRLKQQGAQEDADSD